MFGLLERKPVFRRTQYPRDLAKLVCANWERLMGGDYEAPPLPKAPQVRAVLDACFQASMEQEEGRPLRFAVCCLPDDTPLVRQHDGSPVEFWKLERARQLSPSELKKTAPATNLDSTFIVVRCARSAPSIIGLAHLGSNWESSRKGYGYRGPWPPNALNVRVDGPGRLSVCAYRRIVITRIGAS